MNIKKENSNFESQAEEILAILDLEVDIPETLIERTIQKMDSIIVDKTPKFDFSKYLQVAAVFAAAILIGVFMGKNADLGSFTKKSNKDRQALIELREKHHFSNKDSFGRL